jgi:uncharacterized MAPEG superfamily protein
MTPELTVLTLAGLLQVGQFMLYSLAANLAIDTKKALGPRDEKIDLPTGPARLQRALNNHFEGLVMFTLAVVVLTLGDKTTGLTAACAWTYLGARILYVPAYWLGLSPWRSVIWIVGFLATVIMLVSALF